MTRLFSMVRFAALALALVALGACQSVPPAQKRAVRTTLEAYRAALNAKSYDSLAPLLSDRIRIEGMTDELSRAGLKAGMQWPPTRITGLQIYQLTSRDGLPEARVGLEIQGGVLLMRVGFDARGRIRTIDDSPLWKPRGAVVRAAFDSPFVTERGLLFVRASADRREGWFLVDTGSSDLLLNQNYFSPLKELALPGIVSTVHGIASNPGRGRVAEFRWGGLSLRNAIGQLHDFSEMETAANRPLLGAIGFEQLRKFVVTFDWTARTISVAPKRPAGSPRATVHFGYFLHTPAFTVEIGGVKVPVVFDSGAAVNMLPHLDGIDAHFRPLNLQTKLSDGGRTGQGAVAFGLIDATRLGGQTYRDMPFAIYDVPYLGGHGIIGSPLIQSGRLEIDFPNRTLSLW